MHFRFSSFACVLSRSHPSLVGLAPCVSLPRLTYQKMRIVPLRFLTLTYNNSYVLNSTIYAFLTTGLNAFLFIHLVSKALIPNLFTDFCF